MSAQTQPQTPDQEAATQQDAQCARLTVADKSAHAREAREIGLVLGLLVENEDGSVAPADPWQPEGGPGGYRQGQPVS